MTSRERVVCTSKVEQILSGESGETVFVLANGARVQANLFGCFYPDAGSEVRIERNGEGHLLAYGKNFMNSFEVKELDNTLTRLEES